jgi:hypothetical protein
MNLILEVISWDEKAALVRDAVGSQVIDAEGASVALNPGRSLQQQDEPEALVRLSGAI